VCPVYDQLVDLQLGGRDGPWFKLSLFLRSLNWQVWSLHFPHQSLEIVNHVFIFLLFFIFFLYFHFCSVFVETKNNNLKMPLKVCSLDLPCKGETQ